MTAKSGNGLVRFRMLGPLRVWDGTSWSPVRAAQQRIVLSMLLIQAGRPVTTDRLVEEIWGEHPPRAASTVVRGYVMRLRRTLGGGGEPLLVTRGGGYELTANGALDAEVFHRLAASGQRALAEGDPAPAVARLSDALALWRGAALADVPATPTVAAHVTRLEQAWLAATEGHLRGRLGLGLHNEVVDELYRLVDDHPLHEGFWAQLMLALYRCGRRSDALQAYQRARSVLMTELGLEPGRELQDLQRAILSGHHRLTAPTSPSGVTTSRLIPTQLPADIAGFTGRSEQLHRLDELLPDPRGGQRSTAVVISAIEGAAGIGKTTLAVHWAHRVADQFPDGQLFVNLRGYDATNAVLSPGEAIRVLLDALQVPPQRLPAGLEAQVGLYRSLLSGRRVLILLDNARDAAQVRPLLPNSPGCLVLITSRSQLTGLVAADGAHPIRLDFMPATDALRLLENRLGAERLAADGGRLGDEVINRCAGLPLALALVAARAAPRPEFGLGAVVRELREGLDAFASGDDATDVRAVFSWSYQALRPEAARLFRLLAGHPGPDVGHLAAASLAGIPPRRVRPLLAELSQAHLVNEVAPGRYAYHDLLRAYATELAGSTDGDADRRAARHRLLDHYLHSADAAAWLVKPDRDQVTLDPPQPGVVVEHFTGYQEAMTWFGNERSALLAAVRQASDAGYDRHAWQLPSALAWFLDRRGHWHEQLAAQTTAREAAARLDDSLAQINALVYLVRASGWLGRFDDAHTHLQRSVALSDQLGDRTVRALTHFTAGRLLSNQRRNREAHPHYRRALDLYRTAGHLGGQARALNSIGWNHAEMGEHDAALAYCEQALAIVLEIDDRAQEGIVRDSIGFAHHHLGDHDQAAACYERALALHREVGNRYFEAETLVHLGDNHHAMANLDAACGAWRDALAILDELGHTDVDAVRSRLRSVGA